LLAKKYLEKWIMERNWDAMKRALMILRFLRQEPADKTTLIHLVRQAMPEAYTEDNEKAQSRTFERDLENVRYRLGAEVVWDPGLRQYTLRDPGSFVQAALPSEALNGLAFLMDSFTTSEEIQAVIRPLLQWVEQAIPTEQLRRMTHHQVPLQLNIQRISEQDVHSEVWEKVIYAIRNRRIIEFFYTSPHHEKTEPRRHRVEPYEHYFRNGHFYMKAYCLRWVAPNSFEGGKFWANPYRLNYISPNEFIMLGSFVHREKQARMVPICYKLSPQIVRGGISRYFANMEVGEPDEDGWVEVTASTDNEFEAYRTLLAYGNQCVVLEPPSLVDRLRKVVQSLHYHYLSSSASSSFTDEPY
jgi:predicted DNA-binding transcriptional regulator YafY